MVTPPPSKRTSAIPDVAAPELSFLTPLQTTECSQTQEVRSADHHQAIATRPADCRWSSPTQARPMQNNGLAGRRTRPAALLAECPLDGRGDDQRGKNRTVGHVLIVSKQRLRSRTPSVQDRPVKSPPQIVGVIDQRNAAVSTLQSQPSPEGGLSGVQIVGGPHHQRRLGTGPD